MTREEAILEELNELEEEKAKEFVDSRRDFRMCRPTSMYKED